MTKYRRMVVSQHGGPKVLHVIEDTLPEPQSGEVRVRILAAGVSFADVLMREGIHPETMRPPFTLGTLRRHHLFRPDPAIRQLYLYTLALCAKQFGIQGRFPDFLRLLELRWGCYDLLPVTM